MTRIFTDGAEMRDALFWDNPAPVTVVSALPTPYASAYCYKIANNNLTYKSFTAVSELYLRERVQFYANFSNQARFPNFRNSTSNIAWLQQDAIGHLCYYGTSLKVDSGVMMNQYQWYLIEVYFKIADSGGRFVVYLDNTKVIDYTGDTKPSTVTTVDNIEYDSTDNLVCLDDLAMNDTDNADGKNDNSWCGPGVVVKITPDGDGSHNNWTGLDGDKISNYLQVDEYPHDTDTSYVYAAAGSDVQDQYAMSDYSGTNKTILRVWTEARAKKTSTDGTLRLGILPSGGSDDMSAERSLTTSYTRVVGSDYKVNPFDSGAWEEADVDAIEAIIQVDTSSSTTSSSSSSSSSTTSSSSSTEIP